MSTPILATKLHVPSLGPHLVRRARLIERLNAGLHGKLTLISAPAGFGKTTVISEWLAACAQPVTWLSLDESDSDPMRFLAYLVAALQAIEANLGIEALEMLQSPQPLPNEAVLTTLLNDIADLPQHCILVLDDYHLLDAKPIDDAIAFLLEHLPPQLHLVITTREDPNLPLARLRAQGQLTELRAADLRFTADEAAAFLNQMMGLGLTIDEVAALEARTEGWIAGLQLAAISMQGHHAATNTKANFIESFTGSHRFVMDYLVEEVLEQQSPAIQRFLLHTAILNRLCGPLCDALLLNSAGVGQATLESLEQANLFLIPLDNERRWYRYHHLFADLLRQRLQKQGAASSTGGPSTQHSQDDIAEIHRRASRWYEKNDLALEALHHALAAEDFARAAALLERTWRAMDDSRQSARWLRWVQALPDAMIRNRPVLSAGYGWALLESGELEAAEARLHDAERWLDRFVESDDQTQAPATTMRVTDEAEFQSLSATIATARTYYALALGDLSGTIQYARRALDLLPVDNQLRRGVPATLLGLAHWAEGELDLAQRTFADGMASFRMAGNLLFAITGAYILADMKRVQGHLHAAMQIYQQWLQIAADQTKLVRRGSADLYTGLSELACERGNLETATAYLQKSVELGAQSPLPRWRHRWCLAQARLKQAQGDLDAALELLEEAEREYVRGPVPDLRPIGAMKARVWVMQGRLTDAATWAHAAGLSADNDLSYIREFEHITLARLLIAQARSKKAACFMSQATELLTRLLHAAEEGGRMGSVIEILILQALARAAPDDLLSALEALGRALSLAAPEGYIQLFVDEGQPMAHLLAEAKGQRIMPDYVTKLLAAFDDAEQKVEYGRPQASLASNVPHQPLIDPLSERELEVLQLVALGLSNRQIAERLFIAVNTVKGHNRVIFGKLQVQRRTEAVARARELGLM